MKKFLIILLLLFLPSQTFAAQVLSIDSVTVDMGTPAAIDYENGYKENLSGNILTVDSDIAWRLMVRTDETNMGTVSGYTKPIADFYWKARGSYATQTSYIAITSTDTEVARGEAGNLLEVPVDYKILLSWDEDRPGSYSLTLTFTLTSQ